MSKQERMKMMTWTKRVMVMALVALSGCGGNPPPVVAPPTNPYGYAPTTCPAVSGAAPLLPGGQPFTTTLTTGYGATEDSLTVTLFYQNAPSATDYLPSIVGTGTLSFPDIVTLLPYPTSAQQTSFCVTSADPTGGAGLSTGVFSPQDQSLAIVLKGFVNVPYVSPFSGYPGSYYSPPGSSGAGHEMITVSIGWNECGAVISGSNRIEGCIDVKIGQGNSAIEVGFFGQ
jgi:hypothetical protein